MRGAVLYGPYDLRFEERDTPTIINPTDAIVRNLATCVCGSDLWPYRGISPVPQPTPMGHEYCGIVEEVGTAVTSIKRGQFVIGSFFASDNTCADCHVRAVGQINVKHFGRTEALDNRQSVSLPPLVEQLGGKRFSRRDA